MMTTNWTTKPPKPEQPATPSVRIPKWGRWQGRQTIVITSLKITAGHERVQLAICFEAGYSHSLLLKNITILFHDRETSEISEHLTFRLFPWKHSPAGSRPDAARASSSCCCGAECHRENGFAHVLIFVPRHLASFQAGRLRTSALLASFGKWDSEVMMARATIPLLPIRDCKGIFKVGGCPNSNSRHRP